MAVSTISGSIKWTGLASDTDFGAVVQQLVAIEQRTITRQETWKSEWEQKLVAINGLDTRLTALKLDAQGYDTREELLSRTSTTSNEQVATMTNLSTAPAGVYEVEVGGIINEKIGSKSYQADEGIGYDLGLVKRGVNGELLDEDGNSIKVDGEDVFLNKFGHLVDSQEKPILDLVNFPDFDRNDPANFDKYGYPIGSDGKIIYEALAPLPTLPGGEKLQFQPITITMGGNTLTLEFDPQAEPGNDKGLYNGRFTLDDLALTINNTVAELALKGEDVPKISASVIFDKNRSDGIYNRLVITGLEGGSANHITIEDPTSLGLNKKHFDEPVTNSLVGSDARPQIVDVLAYTGCSNKTITFVITQGGVLGEDDITIAWADTDDMNRGSFTITASDWRENQVKEYDVLQGLKLTFEAPSDGRFIANEAFTIDCQVPALQQAADSGLAASDKWVHQGFADQTSTVARAGQDFVFSYAGKKCEINITSDLSLSALADRINGHANNPGVIASVINDGMGTATSYKLVLTGAHTGVEYGIEVLDSDKQIPGFGKGTFEQVRRAANSMTRFEGYPNDGVSWLQRPTNEVGDVIQGTVVNLVGVGRATFTIRNNVTEMANKIKAIVESVNLTKSYIKQNTKFGGGKTVSNVLKDGTLERGTEGGEPNGIMIGNYGFQISLTEIDRLMTRAIFSPEDYYRALYPEEQTRPDLTFAEKQALYDQYVEENGLIYTRLSDIGIRSDQNQDGVYVIEESRLMECLSRNPEAVIKLFTFTNGDDDFRPSMKVVYDDEDPRPVLSGFSVQMGYRMSDLTRPNDVIDPQTGNVSQPAKGICKVLAENYINIISGIDSKIAREKRRLDLYEERLTQKFARLEVALAQLNSTSQQVAAQMAQLSPDN